MAGSKIIASVTFGEIYERQVGHGQVDEVDTIMCERRMAMTHRRQVATFIMTLSAFVA